MFLLFLKDKSVSDNHLGFKFFALNCVRRPSENTAVDKYIQAIFARVFLVLVSQPSTVIVFI